MHKKTENIILKVKTFFANIYQSHEVLKIEEDLTFAAAVLLFETSSQRVLNEFQAFLRSYDSAPPESIQYSLTFLDFFFGVGS